MAEPDLVAHCDDVTPFDGHRLENPPDPTAHLSPFRIFDDRDQAVNSHNLAKLTMGKIHRELNWRTFAIIFGNDSPAPGELSLGADSLTCDGFIRSALVELACQVVCAGPLLPVLLERDPDFLLLGQSIRPLLNSGYGPSTSLVNYDKREVQPERIHLAGKPDFDTVTFVVARGYDSCEGVRGCVSLARSTRMRRDHFGVAFVTCLVLAGVVQAGEPAAYIPAENLAAYVIDLPLFGGLKWPGGFNALFADGSVRFIKNSVNREVMKALTTRNGGEVINPNNF